MTLVKLLHALVPVLIFSDLSRTAHGESSTDCSTGQQCDAEVLLQTRLQSKVEDGDTRELHSLGASGEEDDHSTSSSSSIGVHADVVTDEVELAPGADRATTKFLEGVPIYNYHMAHAGGMQPSLLELSQQRQWIIMFPDSFSDAQLNKFCDNPPGNSMCEAKGHPDEGGLDFVEFKGTQGELKEVLKKHPSDAPKFIEPDMEFGAIPEIKDEDTGAALVEVGGGDVPWGLDRIDDASGLDGSYHFPAGSKQGAGVNVYVADTGVRTTHQDFEGRAVPLIDCSGQRGGCRECYGDTRCANDLNGHGTHCAGTIGGKKYGVAKKVSIYGLKVLSNDGRGFASWAIKSLDWVTRKGTKPAVWSASLGGDGRSQTYNAAIGAALAKGIVISVAAGNENTDACSKSPAFAPGAITVGATDNRDKRASFSNYGQCLDIYAPGVHIKSATYENDYGEASLSGTSMACPHVSGVLALILGDNPSMSPAQAEALLKSTAGKGMVQDPKWGSPNLMLNSMFAPASPPTPPAAPGAYWKLEEGPCTIDAGNPKCVLSPDFPYAYPSSKSCKIGVMGQGPLDVQAFNTEQSYDKLNVNGQDYSGTSGPTGVTAQGTITWTSDDAVEGTGWKICSGSAPIAPAAPTPPDPPARPPTPVFTCSFTRAQMAKYCANHATYPFFATTRDCRYSWYHSSPSAAVAACQNGAGQPCYVYDQYGSRCW